MKLSLRIPTRYRPVIRGFTLVEAAVGTLIMSVVATAMMSLYVYGSKSFVIMGNYSDLDGKSRNTVDKISREIRNASALTGFSTNSPKYLQLFNSTSGSTTTITYDPTLRVVTIKKVIGATTTITTNLTQCDQWTFELYSRAPNFSSTNITFYYATNGAGQLDMTRCKLINMSWKCSRQVMGTKLTTESVETAQIVLRNKVN